MKLRLLSAAIVGSVLFGFSSAQALDGCVPYGVEKMRSGNADFAWYLCPKGAVYETMYGYFGIEASPAPISRSYFGVCSWNESLSTWVCPAASYRCTSTRCS